MTPSATGSTWWPRATAAPTPRWRSGPTGSPTTWPTKGVGPGDHVGHLLAQQRGVGRDGLGGLQAAGGVDQHQLPLRQGRAPVPVHQRRPGGAGPPGRVRAPGHRAAPRAARSPARDRHRGRVGRTTLRGHRALRGGPGARAAPSATSRPAPTTTTTSSTPGEPPGMPKGVVWRHEDVFYALGRRRRPPTNTRIQRPGGDGREGAATDRSPSCPSPPSCTAPPSGR